MRTNLDLNNQIIQNCINSAQYEKPVNVVPYFSLGTTGFLAYVTIAELVLFCIYHPFYPKPTFDQHLVALITIVTTPTQPQLKGESCQNSTVVKVGHFL